MVRWTQFTGHGSDWDQYLAILSGNFYQTYGWGETRKTAGWKTLRLLAWRDGMVVALASILVRHKAGMAVCWIPGGPAGEVQALSNEFRSILGRELGTKFFYCRLSLLRSDLGFEASYLEKAGWRRPQALMSSGLTMLYSLNESESERIKRSTGNWRHNLKRSGKYQLTIELWERPDIDEISLLYREMEGLKSLPIQHTKEELSAIFKNCGSQIIAYRCLNQEGRLLAFRAAGIVGDIAIDLLAAAGSEARKVYATHATLWALLDHCKQLGILEYDLSGVDPVSNKGVFDFKHGTGATLINCLGEWDWASWPGLRQLINWMILRKKTV